MKAAFAPVEVERSLLHADPVPIQGQDTRGPDPSCRDQPAGVYFRNRGGKRPLPAPGELRRLEVGRERLAILLPADLSPGEGDPAPEVEPFAGEEFPRHPPRETPLDSDAAGKPAAKWRQVDPRPFRRHVARLRDGEPGGCRGGKAPLQHPPSRRVELDRGVCPLFPTVEAERALLHGDAVLLSRQGSPCARASRYLGPLPLGEAQPDIAGARSRDLHPAQPGVCPGQVQPAPHRPHRAVGRLAGELTGHLDALRRRPA